MSAPDTSTLAGKIAVMQAYGDGKAIEVRNRGGWDFPWRPIMPPRFNWEVCDYRIAEPAKAPREFWLNRYGEESNLYAHASRLAADCLSTGNRLSETIHVIELLPGWRLVKETA